MMDPASLASSCCYTCATPASQSVLQHSYPVSSIHQVFEPSLVVVVVRSRISFHSTALAARRALLEPVINTRRVLQQAENKQNKPNGPSSNQNNLRPME